MQLAVKKEAYITRGAPNQDPWIIKHEPLWNPEKVNLNKAEVDVGAVTGVPKHSELEPHRFMVRENGNSASRCGLNA